MGQLSNDEEDAIVEGWRRAMKDYKPGLIKMSQRDRMLFEQASIASRIRYVFLILSSLLRILTGYHPP
ncbi:MAG: hypothetical protein ACLQF0_09125 [Dissulfurispiraceae bacterium]